jgi:hypothetical protein
MFRWLSKYIKRIDLWGVGVELREPPAEPTTPASPAPKARANGASSTSGTSVSEACEAFLREVERSAGAAAGADYKQPLDELVRWSEQQAPALGFVPHGGSQALAKYCLPGVKSSFWSAWPRRGDGAKLHVLTDPHPRFPEELREVARRELARLDGREAKPGEIPVVSFANLRSEQSRRDVEALLSRLLREVCGPTSEVR